MDWNSSVVIPEDAPSEVYKTYMLMIAKVALLSRVPRNATWRAYRRGKTKKGVIHFLVASWKARDVAY